MSENIIPNCIGRLDDVTSAMRMDDSQKVVRLIANEVLRQCECYDLAHMESDKQLKRLGETRAFLQRFTEDREFQLACVKAAGG